jgi:co-chaperonin GroES (HSP10)
MMMHSAKAVGITLLVKVDDVMQKTASGIVLALDENLERGASSKGMVLDVGPEAFKAFNKAANTDVPWVKVGDHIYFAKYAGKWIKDAQSGEQLMFIRDEDVVGLVE